MAITEIPMRTSRVGDPTWRPIRGDDFLTDQEGFWANSPNAEYRYSRLGVPGGSSAGLRLPGNLVMQFRNVDPRDEAQWRSAAQANPKNRGKMGFGNLISESFVELLPLILAAAGGAALGPAGGAGAAAGEAGGVAAGAAGAGAGTAGGWTLGAGEALGGGLGNAFGLTEGAALGAGATGAGGGLQGLQSLGAIPGASAEEFAALQGALAGGGTTPGGGYLAALQAAGLPIDAATGAMTGAGAMPSSTGFFDTLVNAYKDLPNVPSPQSGNGQSNQTQGNSNAALLAALGLGGLGAAAAFGGDGAPNPANTGAAQAAALRNAQLGTDTAAGQLKWAQQRAAVNQALLQRLLQQQIQLGNQNQRMALEDRAYQLGTFRPIEKQLAAEAAAYDTPQRRQLEAGRAAADVSQAAALQRGQLERQLQAAGVDPNQGRFLGSFASLGRGEMLGRAGAVTNAARRVEDTGRAFKFDVTNLGRGLPSSIQANLGGASNAITAAGNASNAGFQTASGALQAPASYLGASNQSLGAYGGLTNQQFQNQLGSYNAQGNPLGSALGFGAAAVLPAAQKYIMSAFGFSEGGEVPRTGIPVAGREVRGPGTGTSDSIPAVVDGVAPAALSSGEFVIPAKVVRAKGSEFFDKMIAKYEDSPKPKSKGLAKGGVVEHGPYTKMLMRMQALGRA